MEPVCEAKFSNNSYGFRPNHSVENAIARSYQLLQHANLHYVIEFDIKGFFDNVNHAKLIRQIWAMGIHDKKLIFLIKRILKTPITPREVIRDFIEVLDIVYQNPGIRVRELLGSDQFRYAQNAVKEEQTDDSLAEFEL